MKKLELTCTDPGAIQDWELDAYAEGETLPHVAEHLDHCPRCRATLAENLAFERGLRQALYRANCPSPDLLRDRFWGELSPQDRQKIDRHLEWCPHCAAELSELRDAVEPEQAPPLDTWLARAQQAATQAGLLIARLVPPRMSPALALRGNLGKTLLFEAGDLALSVDLQVESSGTYILFGQILSSSTSFSSEDRVRLTSYTKTEETRASPHVVQAEIDANGSFVVHDLRPGMYQLAVSVANGRIVVPGLELKAEP